MANHFLFIVVLLLSGSVAAVQSNLPLDQAARDGNLVEVKRLLDKGADPNEINKWGTTALTGASSLGANSESHTEIIRVLLRRGADVNKRVLGGTTAINEASYWGHESTVRVLLGANAYVDHPKDNGYTALLSAASRGLLSIVQMLIKSGANVNHQGSSGLTALHMASGGGFKDVVTVLLAAGAQPDLKNVRGETYLDIAGRTAELQGALTAATTAERTPSMLSTSVFASWINYLIVFSILFVPPTIIRLAWRRPLAKTPSIVVCVLSYFPFHILFHAIGAQDYTNLIFLCVFASYFILRYQTTASAATDVKAKRKELGYDE